MPNVENRYDLALQELSDPDSARSRELARDPAIHAAGLALFRRMADDTAEPVADALLAVSCVRKAHEARESLKVSETRHAAREREQWAQERAQLARREPGLYDALRKHARLVSGAHDCDHERREAIEAETFNELLAEYREAHRWTDSTVPSFDEPWSDDAIPLCPELSLIRARTLTVVAEQGRGKSTIARWICVCVAAGLNLGRFKLRNPAGLNTGRVLYIAAEQSVAKVGNDIKRIALAMGLTTVPHVEIVKANDKTPDQFEAFLRERAKGYDLVVVDTVRQFCAGDENEATWGHFWNRAERVADLPGYGFACIMIAHPGKSAPATTFTFTDPKNARGSSTVGHASSYLVWQSSERGARGIARSRWQWFDKCGRDSYRTDSGELRDVATHAEFVWLDEQAPEASAEARALVSRFPDARLLRFDAFEVEATDGQLDAERLGAIVAHVTAEEKAGRATSENGIRTAVAMQRAEVERYLANLCESDRLLAVTGEAARARGLKVNSQTHKVYVVGMAAS